MAMEREAWPGENEEPGPAEGEEDPGKNWYFDLPGGAWERQEEKNRDLRQSVLENIEGESRRRTFPGTEPEPEEERGRFGRRKKQHDAPIRETTGGTYQLRKGGVDADAWKRKPQDARGWDQDDDDETEDEWRREARGRDVPPAGHRAEQPRDRQRPEHDEVDGADSVPLLLRRRRPAEREAQPDGGRWSDAFGSQGGPDEHDGALSTGFGWGEPGASAEQRPRRRRILPDAAPQAQAEEERPHREVPPVQEKPRSERPRVEPGEAWQEPEEPKHERRDEPRDVVPAREEEPKPRRGETFSATPDDSDEAPAREVAREEKEKPESRWEQMFGGPADDGGVLEGMRQWSAQSRAKSRSAWGGRERPRSLDTREPRARLRDESEGAPAPARRWSENDDSSRPDRTSEPGQPPTTRWEEQFGVPPEPTQRRDRRMLPPEGRAGEADGPSFPEVSPDREQPVRPSREGKFGTPERVTGDFDRGERGGVRPGRGWEDEDDPRPLARRARDERETPGEYEVAEPPRSAPEVEQQGPPATKQNPWSASRWGPDDYEEPEIDEDLDLFRPGAESREVEPPEKERKGRGLARIFGRRKQSPEEPAPRNEPPRRDVRDAWEEPRTPRRPIWDERDWGSMEQRRRDEPPPWLKEEGEDEEEPDAAFLQQELERSRSRPQQPLQEDDWQEREERLEPRAREAARGRADPGDRAARRSFTVPDEADDEPRRRDDMPGRFESIEREATSEPRWDTERRAKDRQPRERAESQWTPQRYSYEAEEEAAPQRSAGAWQPEPVEYVEEPPRQAARFEESDDDDDPWAGFLAGRKDSPRTQPERYAQSADRDNMTSGPEEPRWSE